MTFAHEKQFAALAAVGSVLLVLAVPASSTEGMSLKYEFLRGGRVVGHETTDGARVSTSARFYGEINGQPWEFEESARLDGDGVPTSVTLRGRDSSGHAVSDEYRADGAVARWRNDAEAGSSRAHRAFYLTMPILEGQVCAIPEELARLSRALLASPAHTLPLSPTGNATLRRVGALTVSGVLGAKDLVQFEILGLDYSPFEIWLEADGTLFAAFTAGTIVREGWSDVVPALLTARNRTLRDDAAALPQQVQPRSAPFAFVHARLFDSRTGSTLEAMTVVVSGRRIEAVGRDGSPSVSIDADTERIDATGATLVPGLWDMHTHLAPGDGPLHLSGGVTTVRDLGNDVEQVLAMQRDFDAGRAIGPRVLLAGLIDGRGPFQGPTTLLVDNEAEAQSVIERLVSDGFDQVKIYGSIKAALVPFIARLAHEHGLRVGGHVPAFMTARQAVEAGFDEINHINYMFLNFMPDVKHLESPERVTATANGAANIDLGSEAVRDFIGFLRQHRTIVDPTLSTWETRLIASAGRPDPAVEPEFDRLPVRPRRAALRAGLAGAPDVPSRYRDAFAAMLRMDRLLYQGGVTLVTGSDGLARFGFHRELELQVQSGLSAARVLQMATLEAARVMHRDDEVGTIEVGRLADLVLIAGAPDRRIADVRRTRFVVKDGRLYDVSRLDRALALRGSNSSTH